ncbi:hypothetical protein ACIOC1_26170 [Streptomyces sp. NPDC088197]|uniref:hypothetical protein n=1 Tax=unclassified Streptomyces TaxID=2593676 RepID=UPI0036EA7E40
MATSLALAGKTFDIFTAEPILLSRINASPRRWLWLCGIPVVTIVLLFEFSGLYGAVTMPHLGGQLCSDLAQFLRFDRPDCRRHASAGNRFPLLRDLLSLSAIVILLITPALVQRQWSAFENLLPGMERDGSLTVPANAAARARIHAEIDRTNLRFRRIRNLAPIMIVGSFVCVFVISLSEKRLGIYYALAPAGQAHAWGRAAYANWWASWQTSPVGAIVYLTVGTAGVYWIAVMNCAGSRVLLCLWRLRGDLHYGVDPANADGSFGWGRARAVLVPTYTSMALHGFALIAVGISLPFPCSVVVLIPVVGQWLLALPVYTGLPLLLTRRWVRGFKRREEARLRIALRRLEADRAALLAAGRYFTECEALSGRLARVRDIRSFPFNRPRDIVLAAANLLATAGGVYSLFLVWY